MDSCLDRTAVTGKSWMCIHYRLGIDIKVTSALINFTFLCLHDVGSGSELGMRDSDSVSRTFWSTAMDSLFCCDSPGHHTSTLAQRQ